MYVIHWSLFLSTTNGINDLIKFMLVNMIRNFMDSLVFMIQRSNYKSQYSTIKDGCVTEASLYNWYSSKNRKSYVNYSPKDYWKLSINTIFEHFCKEYKLVQFLVPNYLRSFWCYGMNVQGRETPKSKIICELFSKKTIVKIDHKLALVPNYLRSFWREKHDVPRRYGSKTGGYA